MGKTHSYPRQRTTYHITIVFKEISKDHIWIKKKMDRDIYEIYRYKKEVVLYDRSGQIEIKLG